MTIPAEVEIVPSKIDGAGFGVVARTFTPKYTWLGEYEGFTVGSNEEDYVSDYAWTVSSETLVRFNRAYWNLAGNWNGKTYAM